MAYLEFSQLKIQDILISVKFKLCNEVGKQILYCSRKNKWFSFADFMK